MPVSPSSELAPSDSTSIRGQLQRTSIGTRSEVSYSTYHTALSSNHVGLSNIESDSRVELSTVVEHAPQDSESSTRHIQKSRTGGSLATLSGRVVSEYIPEVVFEREPPEPKIPLGWSTSHTSNNSNITINTPASPVLKAIPFRKPTKWRHRVTSGSWNPVAFALPLLRSSSHASMDDTNSDIGPAGGSEVPVRKQPTRYKSEGNLYSRWNVHPHQIDELKSSNKPTSKTETKTRRFWGRAFSKMFGKSKGNDGADHSPPGLPVVQVNGMAEEPTEHVPSTTILGYMPLGEPLPSVIAEFPTAQSHRTSPSMFDRPKIPTPSQGMSELQVPVNTPVHVNSVGIARHSGILTHSQTSPVKPSSKRNAPISRQMTTPEIVSQLVRHGLQDLSEDVKIPTFDPLALGGFSDVYRGELLGREATTVAVKVLRISAEDFGKTPQHITTAARELHTWSKCKHPNILPLFGLMTFRGRIGMISPWMDNGTLPRYLETNPEADRAALYIQICEGLSYLHNIDIIHGDLKGSNVLVSEDGTPVLIDFGNSTLKDRSLRFTESTNDGAFTFGWSAPEFFSENGSCQCTKAADVYALGMTLYEVVAGRKPYDRLPYSTVVNLVITKTPPERPVCISSGVIGGDKLWDLLKHCWSYDPAARPSAIEVTIAVKGITLEDAIFRPLKQLAPVQ